MTTGQIVIVCALALIALASSVGRILYLHRFMRGGGRPKPPDASDDEASDGADGES